MVFSKPALSLHKQESSGSTVFARIVYQESSRVSRIELSIKNRVEYQESRIKCQLTFGRYCNEPQNMFVSCYRCILSPTLFQDFLLLCASCSFRKYRKLIKEISVCQVKLRGIMG